MEFKAKYFYELTNRELYEILRAREAVFVVEQQCPYQDIDGKDYGSLHVFSEENDRVTSCLRLFQRAPGVVQLGRVITVVHGTGLGGRLLKEGIRLIRERFDAKSVYIEAQCYAIGFYAREGFRVISDEFLEGGIPHVKMELILSENEKTG